MALTTATKTKLSKLIPLLGSDSPGEVVGAVAALKRVLESNSMDFIDLGKQLTKKQEAPSPVGDNLQQQIIINQLRLQVNFLVTQTGTMTQKINNLENKNNALSSENRTLKARHIIDFSGLRRLLFWVAVVIVLVLIKGQ